MYDGLDRVPIKNMNFKQLRERVQILQDRYDALLRRLGGDSYYDIGDEIDWANIVTPLIRAKVNRIEFRASVNSENAIRIYSVPDKKGRAEAADEEGGIALEALKHNLIYKRYVRKNGETDTGEKPSSNSAIEYWYWNANEWKSSNTTFSSEFNQTPAGFQLEGTLEITTDTNGRATISDSFMKMYPPGENGEKGYIPKMQIGYDTGSKNNNPVIILGQGSNLTAVYEENIYDADGNIIHEAGELKQTDSMGYPINYGQGIVLKTAYGMTLGGTDAAGTARYIEIRPQEHPTNENIKPGIYFGYEVPLVNEGGETLYDEYGEKRRQTLTTKIADFADKYVEGSEDATEMTLATEEYVRQYVNQKIREALT